MKILKLTLLSSVFILSCTKDDKVITNETEAIETSGSFQFSDIEELEEKELEYKSIRGEISNSLANNILPETDNNNLQAKKITDNLTEIDVESVMSGLKKYHSERLSRIYEMRKSINFTSIQSIVDEINSLRLVSPEQAEVLYDKYSENLYKEKSGNVSMLQSIAHPNITNADGSLMLGDIDVNLRSKELFNEEELMPILDGEEEINNSNLAAKTNRTIYTAYQYGPDKTGDATARGGVIKRVGNGTIGLSLVWDTRVSTTDFGLWKRRTPKVRYTSFIRVYDDEGGWTSFLAPTFFYSDPNTNAVFSNGATFADCTFCFVEFPSGGLETSIEKSGDTRTGDVKLESVFPDCRAEVLIDASYNAFDFEGDFLYDLLLLESGRTTF